MTKIAIFDDELEFIQHIYNCLELFFCENRLEFDIEHFTREVDFIKIFRKNKFDLIFLDIHMKPLNGFDVASLIRKIDKKVEIVFITGHTEFRDKAYDVFAFGYIVKPIDNRKLNDLLKFYIEKNLNLQVQDEYFYFVKKEVSQKINLNEIFYFEKTGNKIIIHMEEMQHETYNSLKSVSEQLNENFVQCHKGYIVNLNKIKKREREHCIMENDEIVYIGRSYQKKFKEVYHRYLGDLGRGLRL